ncbi:MAG TPA: glycosyltransferase family 2 protein [Terriglobia bacterium]|nr:glycosyltransferase family 2 protein [Terriglobia bacterium]
MVTVSVHIVTFNSAADIGVCLDSLAVQTFPDFAVHILDNASSDETVEKLLARDVAFERSSVNLGFAGGHNALIRAHPADYILILNPDTSLTPTFLERLVAAMETRPDAASASGKLLRMDGATIDSAGIIMLRNQRHLDRGADEPDLGQYDAPEDIFGPSGAAALYRRAALEDVAFDGQYFDEDFFAYREDADLAWRCRLLGWTSIYEPQAVALHRRRVTPERRGALPAMINYHSVKNRFLLRINNMTPGLYRRDFWAISLRDAAVIGYVLAREWRSIPALLYVLRAFPRLWKKRARIQARKRIAGSDIDRWFYNTNGRPLEEG